MPFARSIMLAIGPGILAMAPAAAQDTAPTSGRSIATLAKVPLESRSGARIALGSRLTPGKPTLIAFWASWCIPCFAEAPYLAKIRKDFGGSFNFLYINRREGDPDPNQPPAAIARILAYGGMADVDYVVADVKAYRRILGADYWNIPEGMVGIPRVYLFDRNGRQVYTTLGFQDSDGVALEGLMKQVIRQ